LIINSFICKFSAEVAVTLLAVVPENSSLSIEVAPLPIDVKLPSNNNLELPLDVIVMPSDWIWIKDLITVSVDRTNVPAVYPKKSELFEELNPDKVVVLLLEKLCVDTALN